MTPLEQLKAARELISVPERWTRGDYAQDRLGEPVDPTSKGAVCFCAMGSLIKFGEDIYEAERALYVVAKASGYGNVYAFNDRHEHADVVALFDNAIASLEAQQ